MQFAEQVKIFLAQQQVIFEEKNPLSTKSKFPFLYLAEYNLLLHCIPIDIFLLNDIDSNYFSLLSDEANCQQIKLIHLWEDVWQQQTALIQLRLLALLGKSKRIHARQTQIIRLDKKVTDDFLNTHHLQKTTNAYYKYGLYLKDELVAVCTFSKSRVMLDGPVLYRSFELVRFANKSGTTVVGGWSKLLEYFIKQHHPAHLMTYADRDWSFGEGYIKFGFTFIENVLPQFFLIHPHELIRHYPHRLPQKFSSIEEMQNDGYIKIYNAGNAKFILDNRII
jgi:hypothetical protein